MATYSEALRRLYSDLIVRRARVRVTAASEPALDCDPVFLIGIYRSGTTLLRYVIDSHSNIACPPESAFLSHLDTMLADDRSADGFSSLGFDDEHVVDRMRGFAAYFFENYAASRGKKRWADKSPAYVDHVEFVKRLFPTARFVMIFRHPLDQVHSAVRAGTLTPEMLRPYAKNGEDERIVASRYWAEKAGAMLAFLTSNGESCHRILYEEMCDRPKEVMEPVFDFLGEPWEEQVLNFHEVAHDRGNEDGRVGATRGFSVSRDRYRAWPDGVRARCWEIVSPLAAELGYRI